MINDLRYAVSFPTNGVSLSGQLTFQPGSTAISGQNGTGKSFIAEMIRYGLFGKKALRGPASDYKTLDMELSFSVGSEDYRVVRAKKEHLTNSAGEQIAVGADAINKKIVEILGFDLEVFDVVCAANQKESERLTRLTPTKRKELIDDVVGLTAQEAVEKACREESRGLAREAEALTRSLVLPVEPVKPTEYRKSELIHTELREATATFDRIAQLQRVIDAVGDRPVPPTEDAPDVEDLEQHERDRFEIESRRKFLTDQISRIPVTTVTQQQLDEAEALAAYDAEVNRRGPQPCYAVQYLDEQIELILQKKQLDHDTVSCPKCSHEFCPGEAVDVAAIRALPDPILDEREIAADRRRHELWAEPLVEPKGERMSAGQIAQARVAIHQSAEREKMLNELEGLSTMEDKSAELVHARELRTAWMIYTRDNTAWNQRNEQAQDAQKELAKLAKPKHSLEDLNAAYTAAVVYERELARYDQDKARFDELSAEIAEKQERADAFAAGAKGLVEARRTLKAFLAPSLSRVASKVIREMTANSQRPLEEIIIDDEMNITADGQDVSTFNGAHATMINLALRLALGQVLVARVFPVFIGDEIDSDADAGNAQAIADALNACREQLKQIVLISHKRLEGVDHEVML